MEPDTQKDSAALLAERVAGLMSRLRERSVAPAPASTRIGRRAGTGPAPLSFSQQRLWFLERLAPGNPIYHVSTLAPLPASTDRGVLERSVNEVVRRHEALRTTFTSVNGEPVQVVAPELTVGIQTLDLRGRDDAREQVPLLVVDAARTPFDLERGPLLRVTRLHMGEPDDLLILTLHHIVADGWSLEVMVREVAALCDAYSRGEPSPLPELSIQYPDYAVWQRQWLQGEVLEAQLAYWRGQLEGAAVLDLPTDHPRPPVQRFRGDYWPLRLPPALHPAAKTLAQREKATLFMVLLAAFQAVLHRWTGQDDVAVGVPVAGRGRAELEPMVGFFVNTLVLRADASGDPPFRELLRRVQRTALGAFSHQDLPFEMLVERLQPQRDPSRNPLFQVMFQLLHASGATQASGDGEIPAPDKGVGVARFDLTVSLGDTGDRLEGGIEYNTDLFDEATITRLERHFTRLLAAAVADPSLPLSRLPLLDEEEEERVLHAWNETEIPFDETRTLHRRFEAQADLRPEAEALVCGAERLTYGEVERRANRLAHALRARGAGPERLVGICMERSAEMVVAVLGVLKAGGAYVPLDPAYPPRRLAYMARDAGVRLVLTQEPLRALAAEAAGEVGNALTMEEALRGEAREHRVEAAVHPEGLAYVIYTSGSTGEPKGVMIEHRAVAAVAAAAGPVIGVAPHHRMTLFASLSFDASVLDLLSAFSAGATLCVVAADELLPGAPLAGFLRDRGITHTVLPPSALAALPGGDSPALETVMAGGEACTAEVVARWAPGRRFLNLYGPTETTIWATAAECAAGEGNPPIGRPIPNARCYVLDAHGSPVPPGAAGELYVGGAGMGRGYLGRPALTAERFLPDPFGGRPGARLYRTGDRVRHRADGALEFLGRLDAQVKLRGYRIEPGEIEAVLREHAGVREAAVVPREDAPGERRLVAYVEGVPGAEPSPAALRTLAREKLPEHMVPSAFVVLDAFPRTPNGKLDRRALPAPDQASVAGEAAYAAPQSALERLVAGVWAAVLGAGRIGVHDNFFDLGGHSLLVVQVHRRLQEQLGRDLPMMALFQYPTVAALARHLEGSVEEAPQRDRALERAENQRRALARRKAQRLG